MRLDLILIIGLIVNTLFAVLFPGQIFGDDPLGINGIKESKFSQYYNVNGSGLITGYQNGSLIVNNDQFDQFEDAVTSTDGEAGLFGVGELFSFIDWVKVGFNLIKTAFMFIVGFILLLWQLVYPLNFLIGVPFSLLYMFAIASYIMGR